MWGAGPDARNNISCGPDRFDHSAKLYFCRAAKHIDVLSLFPNYKDRLSCDDGLSFYCNSPDTPSNLNVSDHARVFIFDSVFGATELDDARQHNSNRPDINQCPDKQAIDSIFCFFNRRRDDVDTGDNFYKRANYISFTLWSSVWLWQSVPHSRTVL